MTAPLPQQPDDPFADLIPAQDDDPFADLVPAPPIVDSTRRLQRSGEESTGVRLRGPGLEDKRGHSGIDDPDTPAAAARRVQRMAARNAAQARGRAQGEAEFATRDQTPGAARIVARGVKQALGSSLQMIGQAVDMAGAEGVGEKWIERGAAIAAANPTPVESLEEAKQEGGDLGDYAKWLAGAAGKAVGYIGPTLGAGLIGGVPGAAIASAAMGVGETRGEMDEVGNAQKDRDRLALGAGLAIGALDVITPGRLAGRIRKFIKTPSAVTHEVVKEAANKGLRGAAKTVGKDMVIEGVTESVQEALSYLPARAGTNVPIVGKELAGRMLEAGAQGAVGGGMFSGATEVSRSVVEGRRAYQDRKAEAEMMAEAGLPGILAAARQTADAIAAGEAKQEAGSGPAGGAPAPAPAPAGGAQPSPRVFRIPTEQIAADPERFQFKTAKRSRIEKWNPEMADIIAVWRDPADGQTYVVNGHRRLEAAKRLGVPDVDVQFIDAPTAEEARAHGAVINLSQGQGTPVDFAKFLRDTGLTQQDLEERGVLVGDATAKKGIALSRLAPDLFDQIATGKMREEFGVAIGTELADADLQRQVVGILKGAKRMSADEVQEVARQVRVEATESVTQDSLFGEEEDRVSLVVPKARLVAQLRERLTSDKRLFGFVSKEGRAEALSTAGDTSIDVAAAQQRAQESAAIAEVFDRLYSKSGPVATLLTESARRIARGESPKTIAGEIYEAVRTALIAERDAGTAARGPAGEAGAAGGTPGPTAADAGAVPSDRGVEAQQTARLTLTPPTYDPSGVMAHTDERAKTPQSRAAAARAIKAGKTTAKTVEEYQAERRASVEQGVKDAYARAQADYAKLTAELASWGENMTDEDYNLLVRALDGNTDTGYRMDLLRQLGFRTKNPMAPALVVKRRAFLQAREALTQKDDTPGAGEVKTRYYDDKESALAREVNPNAAISQWEAQNLPLEEVRRLLHLDASQQSILGETPTGKEIIRIVRRRATEAGIEDVGEWVMATAPKEAPKPEPADVVESVEVPAEKLQAIEDRHERNARFMVGPELEIESRRKGESMSSFRARWDEALLSMGPWDRLRDGNGSYSWTVDGDYLVQPNPSGRVRRFRVFETVDGVRRVVNPGFGSEGRSPLGPRITIERFGPISPQEREWERRSQAEFQRKVDEKPEGPWEDTEVDVPLTDLEDAKTGEPWVGVVVRGEGGTRPQPRGEDALLGPGRYGAIDREQAKVFADDAEGNLVGRVYSYTAQLNNPLVIDNDTQWAQLTKQAGWPYPNPGPTAGTPETRANIKKLRALIESMGHDGVIIRIPTWMSGGYRMVKETQAKTLDRVFGTSQVVEFSPQPTQKSLGAPAKKAQVDLFARTKADQGEMFAGDEVGQTRDTPVEAGTRPQLPGAMTEEEIRERLRRGQTLQADEYATETRNEEGQGSLLSPLDAAGYPEGAYQSPVNREDNFGAQFRKVFGIKAGDTRKAMTLRQIARKLAKGVVGAMPGGATATYEGARRMGGLAKVAAGFFEPLSEAIRVHRWGWLGTVAHEHGHFISKTYFGWVTRQPATRNALARVYNPPAVWAKAAVDELDVMGEDLYGKKKPAGGYGEEGVAEAFKFFVINPEHLKAKAPTFYRIMMEVFQRDPGFAAPWLEAQDEFARHQKSTLAEQVTAKISVDPEKWAVPDGDTMANLIVEDDWYFRKAIRKLAEMGVKFTAATNPYVLLRLAKGVGARAENIIRKGWARLEVDPATGKAKLVRITRSLKSAVDLVAKGQVGQLRSYLAGMSALDRYAFALHKLWAKQNPDADPKYFTHADVLRLSGEMRAYLEYNYKNIVGGTGYGDVGFTIAQAEDVTQGDIPENVVEAAEIIWENENQAIRAREEAGLLEPEKAELILRHHPHHVSFERVDEIDPTTGRRHPVASLTSSGVMRQTGGDQNIVDPIESTMKNVYRTQRDIAMYRVNTALVKAALKEGGGRLLTEVPTPRQHIGLKLSQMNPRQVIQAILDLGLELPKFADGTPFDWKNLQKWLEDHGDIAFDLFMNVQTPRVAENEDMVFPAKIDGQKKWFQIAPEQRQLYESLLPMSEGELKTWLVLASAPARALRIGATSTPEFGVRNMFRDLFTATVYTRARVGIPLPNGQQLFIPGVQLVPAIYRMISGMGSLLKRDSWYDMFQFAGGDLAAMLLLDRNAQQAAIRELMAERGGFAVTRYFMRHPIELLRIAGSASEQANRIGEFRAVYEAAIKQGFTPAEAMAKAGFAAREGTQDFAKMGKLTRVVNMLIPFAGARMGGYTKFYEEALAPTPAEMRSTLLDENAPEWQRSQQAWAQIAATITIPSLMLYMMQKDDDDYKNIPRWVKAISWPIMLGNGNYIPIPKPPLIGQLFGTIPELLAEKAFNDSERGAGGEIARILRDEFPFDPTQVMPLKPLLENQTGQSLFFRGPLEPARSKNLPPEMRFNRHTSEALIALSQSGFGEAMRKLAGQEGILASPSKLENLVRGYGGGVGKIGLNILDVPVRALADTPYKPEPVEPERPWLAKRPGVKALYGDQPQQDALNIQQFYERYKMAEERHNAWKAKMAAGDPVGAASYFARHQRDILLTATADENAGTPGTWRRVKAEVDKMQRELRELERIDSPAATTARRQITLLMRQLTGAALDM